MGKKKIPSIRPGEARFRDPQDRDFTIMPNEVFFGYPGLSAGARWLYYLLRAYAWGNKAYSYPTVGGLAAIQRAGENTVRRRLKELTNSGLITVESQKGHRNIYWIESLANTPSTDGRGATGEGGQYLNRQVIKGIKQNENERTSLSSQSISNDKTALISQLHLEFAPRENPQAVQTLLAPFATGHLLTAAEITRNNSEIEKPIAYLLGTVRNLSEAESYLPAAQRQAPELPELTAAEYQASLQALERVRERLG